jgi:hypothetical protein
MYLCILAGLIEHRRWIRALCECRNSPYLIIFRKRLRARRAAGEVPDANLGAVSGEICRRQDGVAEAARQACKCDIGVLVGPIMPSCLMRGEQPVRLARLLPVRPLSTVLMLSFTLGVEPSGDVDRWNRSSWSMRNNCAGVDDQSFVEFRSGEVLGFRFGLKCPGCSRASPFQQCTALAHLKSNVPTIRHPS